MQAPVKQHIRALALGLLLPLLAASLAAQPQQRIQLFPQGAAAPAPEHETDTEREETIRRGLEDLASDNEDLRVGAAMLLGKYRDRRARAAVIEAIDDPAVRVRRAAVVSLLEDRTHLASDAVDALLRALGDEDAEIRRHVSFSLPFLLQQSMFVRQPFGGRPADAAAGFGEEARRAVLRAYEDPEVIVRRNLLAAYAMLPQRPDGTVLLRLLSDDDAQVRSAALGLAAGANPRKAFLDAAEHLADDPEPTLRQQLARVIARYRMDAGIPLLERLADDESAAVAVEARLARLQLRPDPANAEALIDRLAGGALSTEQTRSLMSAISGLGGAAPPLLVRILDEGPPTARAEAVRALVRHEAFFHEREWIRRVADEPSQAVRREAVNNLQMQLNRATPALVNGLAESRHAEYRDLAVTLSGGLQPEEAFDPLLDLVLDEDTGLRTRALRELHRRGFPGANQLLARSLRDNDPAIQRTAVELLASRGRGEGIDILREYAENHPGTPLAALIQRELARRGIQIN
ncbi:MAG: HEAT repeat domain-containing protein [Opitutales bacterium]|nr:HEAT repeat domain-containing protein [Opitutales bacterium]